MPWIAQIIITDTKSSLKFKLHMLLFVKFEKQKEMLPISIVFKASKMENFFCWSLDIHYADN